MSAKSVIVTLQQVAEKTVQSAAEALSLSHQRLADESDKLAMLEQYRDQYMNKLSAGLESGRFDIQMHQNYQRFMRKLDEAIMGQQQVTGMLRQQVDIDQKSWQMANMKKFSYEVLGDRYTKRDAQHAQKQEQKLMDEYAMRCKKVSIA